MMITTPTKFEYWQAHQHNWLESGLSQKAYCQQHGISLPAFTYWRGRLKEKIEHSPSPAIIPVKIAPAANSSMPLLELHVGSAKLVFPATVSTAYVSEILRALA